MSTSARILDGPLRVSELDDGAEVWPGAGAVVRFEGVVRPGEEGRPIRALEYEAYEPMATAQLLALAEEVRREHGLVGLSVVHSRGEVPVGACSFLLVVAGAHRKEALAAMDEFIDRLKRDVPIWKRPVWA